MEIASTPALTAALAKAASADGLSPEERAALLPFLAAEPPPGASVAALRALARLRQAAPADFAPLQELVRDAGLHFPNAPKPFVPDPALEERRRILKLRAAEREYSGLTSNVNKERRPEGMGEEKQALHQAAHGINMIFGAIAGGLFFWFAGDASFDEPHHAQACGLFGMVLVLVVEMTLFAIRSHRTIQTKFDRESSPEGAGIPGPGK